MKDIRNIKENEVIHCSTKEESDNIRQLLHDNGFKWCNNINYIDDDNWIFADKDGVGFRIKHGDSSRIGYFRENSNRYTIILAKEYLPTIDDLKEGRVAIINDGTVDELINIQKVVWTKDDDISGDSKYYMSADLHSSGKGIGWYASSTKLDLPLISVKYYTKLINMEKSNIGCITGKEIYSEEVDLIKLFKEGKIAINNDKTTKNIYEIAKYINPDDKGGYFTGYYTYWKSNTIACLYANSQTKLPLYTTDQFIEFINKQQNKQTMKTRKLTRDNFRRIYAVACGDWKETLSTEFKGLLIEDEVCVSDSFYKKMREASNVKQNILLDEIFGKDDNSVDIGSMQVGQIMKITEVSHNHNKEYIGKYIMKTFSNYTLLHNVRLTWDFNIQKDLLSGTIVKSGTKLEIIAQ